MTLRPSSRGNVGAFTLIELVISAALMALILASGYLCLNSGLATQRMVEARSQTLQGGRTALNLMAADLRAACPLSKDIPFAGLNRTLDGLEADNIDFGTHHYSPQRSGEGDFCQTSYFVARDPDSGVYALWRRRNPLMGLNPLAGGQRDEILHGVHGLKFEYYDGLDWYDDWGDPDGRGKAATSFREKHNLDGLPEAVRITLWVDEARPAATGPAGPAGEPPMVLQTVARLQLSGRAAGGGSAAPATGDGKKTPGAPSSGRPEP